MKRGSSLVVASAALGVFVSSARGQTPSRPVVGHAPISGVVEGPFTTGSPLRLPSHFEENVGQADPRTVFLGRARGYVVSFTAGGPRLKVYDAFRQSSGPEIRFEFLGSTGDVVPVGRDKQPGRINYFAGRDPSKWRTGITTYGHIEYKKILPGIDLDFYATTAGDLEFDVRLEPGLEPTEVLTRLVGADKLEVDPSGDLIVHAGAGQFRLPRPQVYQPSGGARDAISGHYFLQAPDVFGVNIGRHDRTKPVVIDPVVVYSTYLGGSASDMGNAVAADSAGNTYIVGDTYDATRFPSSTPFSGTASRAVFATKLDPTGSLVYTTFFIGQEVTGRALAIKNGEAFFTGDSLSHSPDFPTTPGAFQAAESRAAFVVRLDSSGNLMYSTALNSYANALMNSRAIAVDSAGHAFVGGSTSSARFPTTTGVFQPTNPGYLQLGFVTKLQPDGSGLVYSTFIGGGQPQIATRTSVNGLAIDTQGNAYVTGVTDASDFPTTVGAFRRDVAAEGSVFVAKLNAVASAVTYGTFLGEGVGNAIGLDVQGNTYVTGQTRSQSFPTTPQALRRTFAVPGGVAAFVSKVNTLGSGLVYSTYVACNLGVPSSLDAPVPPPYTAGNGIAVGAGGQAYVVGETTCADFPVTLDAFQKRWSEPAGRGSYGDAIVLELDQTGSALVYSTYLGSRYAGTRAMAVAVDAVGTAYITGGVAANQPGSVAFPTIGALQPAYAGGFSDAFVAKIDFNIAGLALLTTQPAEGGDTGTVSLLLQGSGFRSGSTATLMCVGSDISGTQLNIASLGQWMTATFDLRGKAHGTCDIEVRNPDGQTARLSGRFRIVAGSSPPITVDVVGRSTIRAGIPSRYSIVYRNPGNVDQENVGITISVPEDATFKLQSPIESPQSSLVPDWSEIPPHVENPGHDTEIPLIIPRVPADGSGFVTFDVTASSGKDVRIKAFTTAAMTKTVDRSVQLGAEWAACGVAMAGFWLNLRGTLLGLVPGATCVEELGRTLGPGLLTLLDWNIDVLKGEDVVKSQKQYLLQAVLDVAPAALACAADFNPTLKPIGLILSSFETFMAGWKTVVSCQAAAAVTSTSISEHIIRVVASNDPNDKSGLVGAGAARYIAGRSQLSYAVSFENVETATAAAQEVVVTDQLDPTKFDLTTFRFGPISFGDTVLMPSNAQSYSTDVDLRPAQNLAVRVAANVNTATGVVTWRFSSIDPITGLLPADPLAGFLPPNRTAPEGQGNVLFAVMSRAGLPTDTEIRNQATIIFDVNAPISTSVWTNTVDDTRPVSRVSLLPATEASTSFTVRWTGMDEGSGIRDFTIFVSDNGGPFSAFQTDTQATSATFVGQFDHTYAFYSIARDLVGNVEDGKTVAEATTRVANVDTTPTCSFSLSPTSTSLPASASTGNTVSVTAAAGNCAWTAASNASFVSITAGASGTGNGTVTYSVSTNTSSQSRTGMLTVAGQTFTVTQAGGPLPKMSLDKTSLAFSALTMGDTFTSRTHPQTVRLTQNGPGPVSWTAASNVPWLVVSPASGSGSALLTVSAQFVSGLTASQGGNITLTFMGAANAVGPVGVTLTIASSTALSPPFGVFDTPAGDATILAGSVAVTGWALDNIGVQRVELWRDVQPGETTPPFTSTPTDPRNGKVFISNATFVDGARPDVEALYPTTPFKYRAGWGYLMLTWGLWSQGNGTYKLYAFAFDEEANIATIGTKTIMVNNNTATKPFGSIDTPGIGGEASGPNFGWALTPKVNGAATCKIQPSGVQVSIDSGPLLPVVYGSDVRPDIAVAFAGFSNSTAAGGHYIFDWTTLADGMHTIGWLITDDCNRADGVGSRFFNVTTGTDQTAVVSKAPSSIVAPQTESSASITVSRGYTGLPEIVTPGLAGSRTIDVAQGTRIEIRVPRGFETAYQVVDGERRALPTGATWDSSSGTFAWKPAAGFLRRYRIVFAKGAERLSVRVVVTP